LQAAGELCDPRAGMREVNASKRGLSWHLPNDPLGAFCRDNHIAVAGKDSGPLAGLTFAAQDVFAIAGTRTGYGHPEWLNTHPPETETATAVQWLLDAGAQLVGRAVSDPLGYSLTGENFHYGTPQNPRAPGRVPGGASSGSAAAVAGGLSDFALGADGGGSVRVPASFCGVFGMRPTHGRVPLDGVLPSAASFECVGWLAQDSALIDRVGRVLLGDSSLPAPFRRVLLWRDAFDMVAPDVAKALIPACNRVASTVGVAAERVPVGEVGKLEEWAATFRIIQDWETWASLGRWISETRPVFGPGVRDRFQGAAQVEAEDLVKPLARRDRIARDIEAVLQPGTVLCLPTVPRPAPLRGLAPDAYEAVYRNQALSLLSMAALAGLPQLSLPLTEVHGLPIGLSIVAARGSDLDLLHLATQISA
jgi:amidase